MYNFDEIIDRRGTNALFVGNAEGCIRLNLAMPRSIIKTGLERMRDAIFQWRITAVTDTHSAVSRPETND